MIEVHYERADLFLTSPDKTLLEACAEEITSGPFNYDSLSMVKEEDYIIQIAWGGQVDAHGNVDCLDSSIEEALQWWWSWILAKYKIIEED